VEQASPMEVEHRQREFRKYAIDDIAGIFGQLLLQLKQQQQPPRHHKNNGDNKEGGKQHGQISNNSSDNTLVIGDRQAENLVSCIECILLYGLKGGWYAKTTSFWGFIQDVAKANLESKPFQEDFKFAHSLYFDNDKDNVERGRAWVRQCLNARRLDLAIRIIAMTPRVVVRWVGQHSVWASSKDVGRLLKILKQMSSPKVKFELQMYHSVRYTWKIVDGFPTRVYCKPKPPPFPKGGRKALMSRKVAGQNRSATRGKAVSTKNSRKAEGVLASLFDDDDDDEKGGRRRRRRRQPKNQYQTTSKAAAAAGRGHSSSSTSGGGVVAAPNSPWIGYTDEASGCMYFYNTMTNESSWDEPEEGYTTHESAANEASPTFFTINAGVSPKGSLSVSDIYDESMTLSSGSAGGGGGGGGADDNNSERRQRSSSDLDVGAVPVKISGEGGSFFSSQQQKQQEQTVEGQKAKGGSAAAESTTTTPWVRFVDESSQCTYYFNAVTGETTWEEPPEGFLTDESALEWHRQSPALPETTRY